jgi:LPS export ABC transporter protein LptC
MDFTQVHISGKRSCAGFKRSEGRGMYPSANREASSKTQGREKNWYPSLFQNPVGFEPSSWKNRLSPKLSQPGFSVKFKEAVPKAEVSEQPHLFSRSAISELFLFSGTLREGARKPPPPGRGIMTLPLPIISLGPKPLRAKRPYIPPIFAIPRGRLNRSYKNCSILPPPPAFLRLFPVIIFLLFTVLLFPGCSFDYGSTLSGGEDNPDIIMNDVEYVRVRDGDPQVRFKAELAERYEESQIMELKKFSFEQFERHSGEINAAGSAGMAHVELDSGNIDLAGGVTLAVESEDIVIETGKLAWKDKERDLSGDVSDEVKINRANGTSFSGWGFSANSRSRSWGFSGGIRGTYIHDDDDEEDAESDDAETADGEIDRQ